MGNYHPNLCCLFTMFSRQVLANRRLPLAHTGSVCHPWEKSAPQGRTGHCRDHSSHAQPGGHCALGIFEGVAINTEAAGSEDGRKGRGRGDDGASAPRLPLPGPWGRSPSLREGAMLRSRGAPPQAEDPGPRETKHKK